MSGTRRWLVCLALAASGWSTAAAQVEVRAFIQPDQGITDEQTVQFVIQVEGGRNVNVNAPRLGELKNLRVIGGPDRSVSSQWVNGRFSSTSRLVYTLLPEGPGPAEIPSIELALGAVTYRTRVIRFEVARASAGSASPPPSSTQPTPKPEGQQQRADVFLRAELGSQEVWLGQAVPLSVTLFAGDRVSNPQWRNEPALSNFWEEVLEVDLQSESYRTTIRGRRYEVYPLARKILVPQTPGKFEIEPYALQLQVRSRSSDPFDFFSFGRGQTIVRKTEPLSLVVKPLPERGRPDDFGGAVGTFKLTASMDRGEVGVNDAVALTATVEGEGFLRAVAAPVLQAPSGMKVFDPEVQQPAAQGRRGKLISRKTWEWILVPTTPGEVKLPEIRFAFFNPNSASYEVASVPLQPLLVRRSDEPLDAPLARGDIRLQQRDLAFIKSRRGPLREASPRAHERGLFALLMLLPLAWVPTLILVGRRYSRLQSNRGLVRARKAGARARRRLRGVAKRADAEDAAAFHEEVARTLVEYVADRFDRSAAGLTYEVADELLAAEGIDGELRRQFRSCLETCDFARFVPTSGQTERREELLRQVAGIIDSLERSS